MSSPWLSNSSHCVYDASWIIYMRMCDKWSLRKNVEIVNIHLQYAIIICSSNVVISKRYTTVSLRDARKQTYRANVEGAHLVKELRDLLLSQDLEAVYNPWQIYIWTSVTSKPVVILIEEVASLVSSSFSRQWRVNMMTLRSTCERRHLIGEILRPGRIVMMSTGRRFALGKTDAWKNVLWSHGYLDAFCLRQFDDPNYMGTVLHIDKSVFEAKINQLYEDQGCVLVDGYSFSVSTNTADSFSSTNSRRI